VPAVGTGGGCVDGARDALRKKDVIGLLAGLAGDFCDVGGGGLGETARLVCARDVLELVAWVSDGALSRVPLFSRLGGGGAGGVVSSESDESTMCFCRAARGLTIPPQPRG
jgi:hypothetical protein